MSGTTETALKRIDKVAAAYYKGGQFNPNQEDYKLWLDSLAPHIQKFMREKGMKDCMGVLNFQRFYFELHEYPMDKFMRAHLNNEEFDFWLQKNL